MKEKDGTSSEDREVEDLSSEESDDVTNTFQF
jgi:hypothetical protein